MILSYCVTDLCSLISQSQIHHYTSIHLIAPIVQKQHFQQQAMISQKLDDVPSKGRCHEAILKLLDGCMQCIIRELKNYSTKRLRLVNCVFWHWQQQYSTPPFQIVNRFGFFR